MITDPGLDKTLLGDGVGSIVGGLFGGAANTTYGESIGCVAITGNASVISIITASLGCMILSFLTPFVVLINSIPKCVMGGACVALYGFIAVSGLQMLKKVDLGNNKNLFVVSAILVTGIGGLALNFGKNSATGGAFDYYLPCYRVNFRHRDQLGRQRRQNGHGRRGFDRRLSRRGREYGQGRV